MPETFFLPPAEALRGPPPRAPQPVPPAVLPQRGALAALIGLVGAVALFVTTLWFVAQQAGIADESRAATAAPRKAEPVGTARTAAAATAGAVGAAWR